MAYNAQLISDMTQLGEPFNAAKNDDLLPLIAAGDTCARERMIHGNVALACTRVESYIRRRPDIAFMRDDLTSCAIIGVCKAVNKIAAGKAVTNATAFLSYWINREILRALDYEFGNSRTPLNEEGAASDNGCESIRREDEGQALIDARDMVYSCCETSDERRMIEMREAGCDCAEIAQVIGVSRATAYRMLKRIEQRYNRKAQP